MKKDERARRGTIRIQRRNLKGFPLKGGGAPDEKGGGRRKSIRIWTFTERADPRKRPFSGP